MITAVAAPLVALLLAAPGGLADVPVSYTVSGGVSLGAYEAGYLFYATAAQRANPGVARTVIATGASAGSVNALLTLRASCADPAPDPRRSLFHRVWVPMGLDELFRPGETSPVAAFSQASFVHVGRLVEEELAAGLPEACDVVLGVVASRMIPRTIEAAGGRLEVPVTEERFVVRIRGRGPGRMPLVTNYVDPSSLDDQALLPEGPDGSVPFASLLDAVIASTSFPVAFPPRPVRHCVVRTRGRSPPFCPESSAEAALFVDGGVFDNSPLRLAATYAAGGLVAGSRGLHWKLAPDLSAPHAPPAEVAFGFLSADAAAFPDQSASEPSGDPSLLPVLFRELGGFVNAARSRELHQLIQDFPTTAQNLIHPQRHFPAASSPMYAFYGFFDRGFREFDFYLGMYEAHRQMETFTLPRLAPELRARYAWPEDRPDSRSAPEGWAPFHCLQALLDGNPDAADRCSGEDLARLRIVAQVSLDRLWDRCRPDSGWAPPAVEFAACRPALSGKPAPHVPGVTGSPDRRRSPDESEAAYSTRLLAGYGYTWSDIPVPPGASTEEVLSALRARLASIARRLAEAQPTFGERVVVGAIGRFGVDLFHYEPPRATGWITLGRPLEFGADWAVRELAWLRLTGALEVMNLVTSFGSSAPPVAFVPLAGFAAVPPSMGSPAFQPSFLLRGGYMLSPNDHLGAVPCTGQDRETIGACSRPVVEAGGAVTLTGIVRLQLVTAWYPPAWNLPGLWAILPTLGVQVGL